MIDPDVILAAIDALSVNDGERDYLGASEIGTECSRALWIQFHRFSEPKKFEPRMLRLFQRGKDEEIKFESYFDRIGIEILETARSQAGFNDGFFGGHGDGIYMIDGSRVSVEMKTHSAKNFATLKRGNLKQSFPKHYAQTIVYTGKFNCEYAIYIAVNKDDDALFIDVIPFDREDFDVYLAKAEYITLSDKMPDRISSKPTAFQCKFCHVKQICWGFDQPRVNCRGCTSATKHRETGNFGCHKIQTEGSPEQRAKNVQLPDSGSCNSHSFSPFFVQDVYGHQPIEFYPKERAVKYKRQDGTEFINGAAPFGIPSLELEL